MKDQTSRYRIKGGSARVLLRYDEVSILLTYGWFQMLVSGVVGASLRFQESAETRQLYRT